MGGLHEILCLIFLYEDENDNSVRIAACRIFSQIVANNSDTQNYARKCGAINLGRLLEWDDKNKTP